MNYCFLKVIQFAYEQLKQKPSSLIEHRELHSKLEQYFEENNLQRKYNITESKNELSYVMNDDFQIIKNKKILYFGLPDSINSAASTMMVGDEPLTKNMIEITKQVRNNMSKISNKFNGTFSQGCEMNSVPKSLLDLLVSLLEGDIDTPHHHETPLVTYLSLLLHNKYRSKRVMHRLHDLGLCIGYNRIMSIVTDLGNAEIQRYTEQNLVCPTT